MSIEYLQVRLSHLLRHCSVGSIVRGPDYLMVVKDIREWNARNGSPSGDIIPYVDQVRAALGIDQVLRTPPTAKELENGKVDGECVPALRFPSWMRCPSCGLMHHKPWKGLSPGEMPRCQNEGRSNDGEEQCKRRPELEQAPWVLAHADGHLADVPWHYLTHQNSSGSEQTQCRADWGGPYLHLINRPNSSRRLICNRCRTTNDFSGSLRIPFRNKWRQPWIDEAPEPTDIPAVVLEVNDARVHSPATRSALVIPPESRILRGTVEDKLYTSSQKRHQIESSRTDLAQRAELQKIAKEFRCSVEDIKEALGKIEEGYPYLGENVTQGILLNMEYEALLKEISDLSDDEDFVTKHLTHAWKRMTQ
ncbi:MAG: hypothetical protein QF437_24715, partial [Planctomycetota bacterium]|nr:hypothetical protein [Planctomycetota bacterium]